MVIVINNLEKDSPDMGISIKTIRSEMGMSQTKFAKMMGVEQGDISKIEKGKQNPSRTFIAHLKYRYAIMQKPGTQNAISSPQEGIDKLLDGGEPMSESVMYSGFSKQLVERDQRIEQLEKELEAYRKTHAVSTKADESSAAGLTESARKKGQR